MFFCYLMDLFIQLFCGVLQIIFLIFFFKLSTMIDRVINKKTLQIKGAFLLCLLSNLQLLLSLHEVTDFGEQFLLCTGFGFGLGLSCFLLGEFVHTLDHQEDA